MKVLNYYHLKGKIPTDAVYIGRESRQKNLPQSKFANPYPITETDTREIVIEKYKKWLWSQIKSGNITLEDLLSLEGKDLVCYCAPAACHGNVLIKAVQWAKDKYVTIYGYWPDWTGD